ncbi:MAG: hypothetical protein BECKG1743E_GA0114224_112762, partial [Candidatus Kentron sp. G]
MARPAGKTIEPIQAGFEEVAGAVVNNAMTTNPADDMIREGESQLAVTARVISGVASHIQVEETEALHVSRIALMVRGYLRSECVKE